MDSFGRGGGRYLRGHDQEYPHERDCLCYLVNYSPDDQEEQIQKWHIEKYVLCLSVRFHCRGRLLICISIECSVRSVGDLFPPC